MHVIYIRSLMTFCVLALTMLVTDVRAKPPDGADDPAMQAAVASWLSGDDATSLPALAALARQGNTAARLLLGRIERVDRAPSPYLQALSPDERKALFRAQKDGSLFFQSWLRIERDAGNLLAILFSDMASSVPNLDVIAALREAGEVQATDHPTRIIGFNGTDADRRNAWNSGLLMPEIIPYIRFQLTSEGLNDGQAALSHIIGRDLTAEERSDIATQKASRALSLGFGYQRIERDNKWYGPVTDWLLEDPSMRPIADLCRASCGADTRQCAMTLMGLTAGYYEVIRLDSPLETVIAQDRFLASQRARDWALRRAAHTSFELTARPFTLASIQQSDRCVAGLVEEARR